MADNNNDRIAYLPTTPNPALKKLDRLIGAWNESGDYKGSDSYEWMEGGFFLIHHFDGIDPSGMRAKGIEYISFDEDTGTLRSHLMGYSGSNFTYTWDITGDTWTIWFGDKGSDNFFQGKFSPDGRTVIGGWQWPEKDGRIGGYKTITTRAD